MRIILASASSRRKELLELIFKNFEIIPSNSDETLEEVLSIEEQSKRLAYKKAKAVFDKINEDCIVIGSDSMVLNGNKIYGKPKDREDAIKMLEDLSGKKHQVITSICVLSKINGEKNEQIDYDLSDVYFKKMSKEEIEKWVDKDKPFDKARRICRAKFFWSTYR